MKATIFILFLAGVPTDQVYKAAFDCNQAAIEASGSELRSECRAFDDAGNEVVTTGGGEVRYIRPKPIVPFENRFVIEVQ